EKIGQRFLPFRPIKHVGLRHLLPRQFLAFPRQLVTKPRKLLLLLEQLLASCHPFRLRNYFRTFPLARRRSHDRFSFSLGFLHEIFSAPTSNKVVSQRAPSARP